MREKYKGLSKGLSKKRNAELRRIKRRTVKRKNKIRYMEFLKSKSFWKIFIIAFIVGVIIGGTLEYIKLTS